MISPQRVDTYEDRIGNNFLEPGRRFKNTNQISTRKPRGIRS